MAKYMIRQAALGPVQTNCYIVTSGEKETENNQVFLVDPGDNARLLADFIEREGLELTAILLTHGHFDHIGAVSELKKIYPGAKVYIGRNDADMLGDSNLNASLSLMGRGMSAPYDETLRDQEEIELLGTRITCIETPGHTKGGMCYYIPDENLLFSGDTLFQGSVGRSDLPTGSEAALVRSCREKLLTLPEETKVLPGHGPGTTIGYEKENNMFLA